MQWCGGEDRPGSPRAGACGRRRSRAGTASRAPLPLDERTILADEQVEMLALFVGEFEEDLLALGVLEALAVLLEEPVRPALAADADHQRLLIVDSPEQPLGALGEQA